MTFDEFVLMVLALLGVAGIIRSIKGPTIWDRMLGFNMISSKILMAIMVLAFMLEKSYYLDIALIYALFGFISIVLIARFIRKRGEGKL